MAKNFPTLKKKTYFQVQKTERIQNKMNPKKSTPRHIIIKMVKVKERILKVAREKQRVTHKGNTLKGIN